MIGRLVSELYPLVPPVVQVAFVAGRMSGHRRARYCIATAIHVGRCRMKKEERRETDGADGIPCMLLPADPDTREYRNDDSAGVEVGDTENRIPIRKARPSSRPC